MGTMSPVARAKKDTGTRESIIDATLDLIKEQGIDQIRAGDVASRLGVSSGLIFYHFDNLQTLVTTAVRHATDRELEHLTGLLAAVGDDRVEALRTVLREYGPTGSAFGWTLWVECWSASRRDPDLRKTVQLLDARWRDVIADLIAAGARGQVFTCDDPAGAARRLTSLLDGLAVQYVVFDHAIELDEINATMDFALNRELGI